jgi:hypothetical protein
LGFKLLNGLVKDQTEAVPQDVPLGMFALRELPPFGIELRPEPFIAGSRDALEKIVHTVVSTFSKGKKICTFRLYKSYLLKVRLKVGIVLMYVSITQELFFAGATQRRDTGEAVSSSPAPTDVTFTGSMQWSGRGAGRERNADVPYVPKTGSNGAPAPAPVRKRRQDRSPSVSSQSSSDGPSFTYIKLSNADAGAVEYVKYVAR